MTESASILFQEYQHIRNDVSGVDRLEGLRINEVIGAAHECLRRAKSTQDAEQLDNIGRAIRIAEAAVSQVRESSDYMAKHKRLMEARNNLLSASIPRDDEAQPGKLISQSIAQISQADPKDVQAVAGGQLALLERYHRIVLGQATNY